MKKSLSIVAGSLLLTFVLFALVAYVGGFICFTIGFLLLIGSHRIDKKANTNYYYSKSV